MAATWRRSARLCKLARRPAPVPGLARFSTHPQPWSIKPTTDTHEDEPYPFKREGFYLTRLGQVLNSRYKIIHKLGHGRHATIWLARDLRNPYNPYVSLRVCANSRDCSSNQDRQLEVHKHLSTKTSNPYGRQFVERCYDLIQIEDPTGKYQCLSQPLTGGNLWEFQDDWPGGGAVFNAKTIFKTVFEGLDYLHSEAEIVHTDLRFETITFPIGDQSSAERAEEILDNPDAHPTFAWMFEDQATAKYTATYSLYLHDYGPAVISDFGEARIGTSFKWIEYVQPNIMRAPEVELRMDWTSKIDIWNAACLMWASIESRYLFDDVDPSIIDQRLGPDGNYPDAGHSFDDLSEDLDAYDVHQQFDPRKYLSNIISVIGMPPKKFLERAGPYARQFFDDKGAWLHHDTYPINKHSSLHALSTAIQKREGRDEFLDLMTRALSWLPEDRPSARELALHPFFGGHSPDCPYYQH